MNGNLNAIGAGQNLKQDQVSQEMATLYSKVEVLEKLFERLSLVLAAVLRSDTAEKNSATQCPQEQLVPLAEAIRINSQNIERVICRLQYLIDRIELPSGPTSGIPPQTTSSVVSENMGVGQYRR